MSATAAPAAADGTHPSRPRPDLRPPLVWGALAALLLVLQYVASGLGRGGVPWPTSLVAALDSWSQFDGPEYLRIATEGYSYTPGVRSNIVWFPAYPNLVRAADAVVGEPLVAGVVVSLAAALAAVCLWWRWLGVQGLTDRTRWVAYLSLLLYPYAWYLYGPVHSDSLFLAVVVGAFLLVEADRLLLAGVVGAVATAGRPTGLAVAGALVVLAAERQGLLAVPDGGRAWVQRFRVPLSVVRARWSPRVLLPGLAVVGVGAYATYLAVRFSDPLAFATNQRTYHPTELPWLKLAFFVRWRDVADDPTYALTITAQAVLSVATLCSTPFVGRRFGWGYAVFTASLVLIPVAATPDFMGSGRYLIAAFPAFALWGSWLARRERRWVAPAVLATSGVVLVGLAMGFARSWYLS